MSTHKSEIELSKLLAQASVQHLRLTLETLPVGEIIVTKQATIDCVDKWTRDYLQLEPSQIYGQSLSVIFDQPAFDFLEMIRTRRYGYVGRVVLRTGHGRPLVAELVLSENIEPHKFSLTVMYIADDVPST